MLMLFLEGEARRQTCRKETHAIDPEDQAGRGEEAETS